MLAARNGNPQAVKLLVEAGADVNARERLRGTTALMWAASQRHPEAVKMLVAAGADVGAKSAGAGVPRNYMANRVNLRAVEQSQERRRRGRCRGHHLRRAIGARPEAGPRSGRAAWAGAGARPRRSAAGRTRRCAGRAADAHSAGSAPAAAAAAAARGRGAGAGEPGIADDDDDDNEVVFAGLVGTGGGGLTRARLRGARGRHGIGAGARRRRRQRQPADRGRLDAAVDRGEQPQLPPGEVPAGARRGPEHRRTAAGGRRCTSPPTTATSRAETIRCPSRTSTTWR